MNNHNAAFWDALDELVSTSEIVIDRPKGSAHPRFPDFVYKVDYGYLKDTSSMDGMGIDIWVGSGDTKSFRTCRIRSYLKSCGYEYMSSDRISIVRRNMG